MIDQTLLEAVFTSIRADCSAETWSQGVELARGQHIVGLKQTNEEASFRIEVPESRVSPEVSLFFEDEDWVCSCRSPEDPCSHVVGAVIALKRAAEQGRGLPGTSSIAHVAYRFEMREDQLALRRLLVTSDNGVQPFWGDLTAIVAGKKAGPRVVATDLDLQIDRLMADVDSPQLSPRVMERVLTLLRGRDDVTLDGDAIAISAEALGHCLTITRQNEQLHIQCKQDPRIVMVFRNGVAMSRDALHPLRQPALDSDLSKYMTQPVRLDERDITEFVARDLPRLKKHMPTIGEELLNVSIVHEKPYLYLESWREPAKSSLFVRPLLAYGKPLMGLVRGERFETFGDEVPIRRLVDERKLRDNFARDTGLDLGRTYEYAGESAITIVESMKFRYAIGGQAAADFNVYGELTPQVRFQEGGLEVAFHTNERSVSADAVFNAWQRKESVVPLMEGGFGRLPTAWLEAHGAKVRDLLAAQSAGAAGLTLVHVARELCRDIGMEEPHWLGEARERVEKAEEITAAALPDGFNAQLRSYQNDGVLWLQKLQAMQLGGLLCDDMGLGKTIQAIAALRFPALIVAPNSLLQNWEMELRKFRPNVSVARYHGPERRLGDDDVTVTTYHTLRQDIAILGERRWQTVIFDESQMIKNPESQLAQASFKVKADHKFALTGTPVENRLEDLWSQMNLVVPGYLGSLKYFRQEVLPSIRAGDKAKHDYLKAKLKPFFLRRLKRNVAKDLPQKTEIINKIELSEFQQGLYQTTLEHARQSVQSGEHSVAHILTALLRLRQICAHPALFDHSSELGSTHAAKFQWVIESLKDLQDGGNKALLFSQWTSLLDLLEPVLQKAGISYLRLDGATKDRQAVVDNFSSGRFDVLLMSLKAGGVGLNLTVADHVLLFDPWWNPAAEAQAIDRVHRIGQQRPVFIHKMIALNTIEERVLELQAQKTELSDMFTGESMKATSLDKNELLSLVLGG